MGKDNTLLNLVIAKKYKQENRFNMALRYSQKVLAIEPHNARALIYSMQSLLHLARPQEAEQLARASLRLPEVRDQARSYLASALLAQRQLLSALKTIRTVLKKHPHNSEALITAALAANDLHRHKEALQYLAPLLRKATTFSDEDKLLLFKLAADNAFELELTDPDDHHINFAIRYYKAVLRLAESNDESIWALAICYIFQHKLGTAKALRKRLVTATPKPNHMQKRALKELDNLIATEDRETREDRKHLMRVRAEHRFLTAAADLGKEINTLVQNYLGIFKKVVEAAKQKKLRPLPLGPSDREAEQLYDLFYEQLQATTKEWQNDSTPLAQLNRKASEVLDCGHRAISSLQLNISKAKEHYRPIQRSLGH